MQTAGKVAHFWIALPCMDESNYLPQLLACLDAQTDRNFTLVAAVNQPEAWHHQAEKLGVCEDNARCLDLLREARTFPVVCMDLASPGNGVSDKNRGVGWARKWIMDWIVSRAQPDDVIISLDADTIFSPKYLEALRNSLALHPEASAVSVPYFHNLSDHEGMSRAILRYEIFMRYYVLNLWKIRSPYRFTALGSAFACKVSVYLQLKGIKPLASGEDFYFMQRLVKSCNVLLYLGEKVFPATRISERVGFGTGPAIKNGLQGKWESYPLFSTQFFQEIGETYALFDALYQTDVPFPMNSFLQHIFKDESWWKKLRQNAKSSAQFIRFCHEKVDGLRILQYLKYRQLQSPCPNENTIREFLRQMDPNLERILPKDFSFEYSETYHLNGIREVLEKEELRLRKSHPLLSLTQKG